MALQTQRRAYDPTEIEPLVQALKGLFSEKLSKRKLLPCLRRITSLQLLTIKRIIKAKTFMKDKYGTLDALLPEPLLELLMTSKETRGMRSEAEDLQLLFTPRSKVIDIVLVYGGELDTPQLLKSQLKKLGDLLVSVPRDTVRTLSLEMEKPPGILDSAWKDRDKKTIASIAKLLRRFLLRLLWSLREVTALRIKNCEETVNDELLDEIASLQLESLDLEGSAQEVTEAGLDLLVNNCWMLHTLNVDNTNIQAPIIASMLQRLPRIENMRIPRLLEGMKLFVMADETNPPPSSLKVSLGAADFPPEVLRRMLQVFPKVDTVLVRSASLPSLMDSKIKGKDLRIIGWPAEIQTQLLERFSKLSYLYVEGTTESEVDLTTVGHFCLDVQALTVKGKVTASSAYPIDKRHFRQLRILHLNHQSATVAQLDHVLVPLLSGKQLSSLFLSGVALPDHVVTSLRVLPSLKDAVLGTRVITKEGVVDLACVAPLLKTLRIDVKKDPSQLLRLAAVWFQVGNAAHLPQAPDTEQDPPGCLLTKKDRTVLDYFFKRFLRGVHLISNA